MLDTIIARQREAQDKGALNIWTVFDRPKDFPESYVARRFEVTAAGSVPTDDIFQGELSSLRENFRRCGLTCLTRQEQDEPQIVECWL